MPLQATAPVLLLPDLSEWQPDADMAGIKAVNGGAAIIRACYGADHPDIVFTRHRAAAAAAGYRWLGIYIYLVATAPLDAQLQAYAAIVGQLGAHEVPVIDLEAGQGNQAPRARQALGWLDTRFGLGTRPLSGRSVLYSGLAFAEAHGLTPIFQSKRTTWLAAYTSTEPTLQHTLWQATDGKRGSHITTWPGAGACDTSVYHGTLDELAALLGDGASREDDDMLNGILLADQATPIRVGEGRPASQLLLSVADGAPAQRLTVSIRDEAGAYTETVSVTWDAPGVLRFRHHGKVKAVSVPQPTTAVSYVLF